MGRSRSEDPGTTCLVGVLSDHTKLAPRARPNFLTTRDLLAGLAKLLAVLGEADEGVALGRRAQRLNPHAPVWYHWNLGLANYYAGRYKDAVELFGRSTTDLYARDPIRDFQIMCPGERRGAKNHGLSYRSSFRVLRKY